MTSLMYQIRTRFLKRNTYEIPIITFFKTYLFISHTGHRYIKTKDNVQYHRWIPPLNGLHQNYGGLNQFFDITSMNLYDCVPYLDILVIVTVLDEAQTSVTAMYSLIKLLLIQSVDAYILVFSIADDLTGTGLCNQT